MLVRKEYKCCYSYIYIYVNIFISDETQTNLVRHLLRTVCTDITNIVLNSIATDHMLSIADESQFTNEVIYIPDVVHLLYKTNHIYYIFSEVLLLRPLEIKTTLTIKTTETTCFSTKMNFLMQVSLINETCSLLRPLLMSINFGCIIGTSLYYNGK